MKPVLSGALQAGFVALLVAAVAAMAVTAHDNLLRQGIASGFGFLFDRTGWDVASSFVAQSPGDPYWRTLLAGLINTLVLSALCIVLATVAGVLLALLGAGQSRILHGLARLYVWTFRNVPLIVQVFFWYHVTRLAPPVRQSIALFGCCYISNRGIYVPHVGFEFTSWTAPTVLVAVIVAVVASRALGARRGPLLPAGAIALVIGAAIAAAGLSGKLDVTMPRLQGFNFVDGTQLSPEFIAMAAAIVAYNVAFVAEIVNSGIRAVPPQQIEAARVIGLSNVRIFWSITIPQAVRIAVPPLINQYISLMKSSSLAIAIGYTDLFAVGVIAVNHTGQSIDVIAVMMLAYLGISSGISALGNAYNRALARRSGR
jgi:general L-amino acid transport system permease protein